MAAIHGKILATAIESPMVRERFDLTDRLENAPMCELILEKPGVNLFLDDPLELTMVKVFRSPRDLLWRMWMDSGTLASWWGTVASPDLETGFELRVGALVRQTIRSAEGRRFLVPGVVEDWALHSRWIARLDPDEVPGMIDEDPEPAETRYDAPEMTQIVLFSNHPEGTQVTVTYRFARASRRDAFAALESEHHWDERFDALDRILDRELFRAVA